MATVLEYAFLSNDVYIDDEKGFKINGQYTATANSKNACMALPWIGLPSKSDLEKRIYTPHFRKDFFARLYANTITNETVIAYRGTDPHKKGDRIADLELTFKLWSNQDDQARNFYSWAIAYLNNQEKTNYSRFPSVTGHSLGGYLAQVIGVEHEEVLTIVFNAPGIGYFYDPYVGIIFPRHKYKKNIYNYDLYTDDIHEVGTLIGNKKTLMGDLSCFAKQDSGIFMDIPGIVCGITSEHSILTVIDILQQHPEIANHDFQIHEITNASSFY